MNQAVLKLWRRVLLHNKLLSEEQWQRCLEAYKGGGESASFEQTLIETGGLEKQHVTAVRRRVQQIVDQAKQQQTGGEAQQKERKAAAGDGADAEAASQGADAAPPAQQQEPEASQNDEEEAVSLTEEITPSEGASDEVSWSESDQAVRPSDTSEEEREGEIDLAEPEDDADPSLKIRHDTGHAAASVPSAKAQESAQEEAASEGEASQQPAQPSQQEAPKETAPPPEATADGERVESPVAPGDVDEQALKILRQAVKLGASDIHLQSGSPPYCRLHGTLSFFKLDPLEPDQARRIALGFMRDQQQQQFLKNSDVDFSYENEELGRFRVNALDQFRGPSIIFRHIPKDIPTLEQLGLPETLGKLTEWTQGLVLITGPAGSGKTTTAAALLDLVNANRRDHVITVEDPVEFVHPSKGCNMTQRQVPYHTESFSRALKGALREDPDVIMIGEMRDLETVSLAMRAAETGHLVLGTLQTRSASRTIDRVVDQFPADQQAQIRTMLAESLRGVVAQQLVKRADGKGRVAALELLYVTRAISNLIRDGKTFQLPSAMQVGAKMGMRIMDDSLKALADEATIDRETAIHNAENPKQMQTAFETEDQQQEEQAQQANKKRWGRRKE